MSIAVQMNSNRIKDMHKMPRLGILNPPEIVAGDLRLGRVLQVAVKARGNEQGSDSGPCASSSSSSSIGKNSDDLAGKLSSSAGEDVEESGYSDEVQSSLKSSFDDAVDALEEALPTRRGISRFYNGKSKSFASLADASAYSSIKQVTKPENAYSRKRKNLLAYSLLWDKKPSSSVLRSHGRGISKRATNSTRSTLGFAVAMSASIDETGPDSGSSWTSFSPLFSSPLTAPSPPFSRGASAWRSFSFADLQHCSTTVNCSSPTAFITDPNKPDQVS
ncbi:hypothetical protein Dimus_010719 [Dionaea muscipula]